MTLSRLGLRRACSCVVFSAVCCSLLGLASLARCGDDSGAKSAAKASDDKRTFYVDSHSGSDSNDGQTPDHAWQSLGQVNQAPLKPGDTVRFQCGGVWRGVLNPVCGSESAPITYTSYGQGPRPLILGSLQRNRSEDWAQISEKVWATLPTEYKVGESRVDFQKGGWNQHQEGGANVDLKIQKEAEGPVLRLTCTESGKATNHVQLWGPEVRVQKGEHLLFTFRARSSKPCQLPSITVSEGRSPWACFASSHIVRYAVGAEWSVHQAALTVGQTSETGRLHISLGGLLPAGAVCEFQPLSLKTATPNIADPLSVDVGNIIFDEGAVCGWKKWSVDDLKKPYDYYYDGSSQRVYLYSEGAPTSRHRSIELAMARHVVNQNGKHYVVYDGLAIRNGAAHGFGGGNTHHLVIRNCELSYIGGAHQHTTSDGRPVRFGNAIEFWGAARDNLVEGCHIWQVYDAALTNQGQGADSKEINITYRNNLVHNAEYSFEYWNNPETAVTQNIRFINNTCIDAGIVWSHEQRPDRNGSHLMFYSNTAATSGIEIKYNVFCGATEWGSRYSSGWKVLPDMDYNLWFSTTGVMANWFQKKLGSFDEYRQTTGLDAHSQFADPKFVNAAAGDYRLAPDSPARKLCPDGSPVGVISLWK